MVGRSDKPAPRIRAALRTFAVNAGAEVSDMPATHTDVVVAVVGVPEPVQSGVVAHAPTLPCSHTPCPQFRLCGPRRPFSLVHLRRVAAAVAQHLTELGGLARGPRRSVSRTASSNASTVCVGGLEGSHACQAGPLGIGELGAEGGE